MDTESLLNKLDRNVMDLMSQYDFEIRKIFPASDKILCWKNFELLACYITRTIPWGQLPIEYRNSLNITYMKDCGIDGMTDKITMQAKFRGKNSRVSWEEVAKFLAMSYSCGKQLDKMILCCNVERISKVQEHVYEKLVVDRNNMQSVLDELKQKHDVGVVAKRNYDDGVNEIVEIEEQTDEVDNVTTFDNSIDNPINTPRMYELRDYQLKALSMIKDTGTTKISLPCGTGKTYLIHTLCKDMNQRIVIFVPTRVLLEQTHLFMQHYGIEVERVGTTYNNSFDIDSKIFVCVFDSAYRLKDISFDTKIIDEAHLTISLLTDDDLSDDTSDDDTLDDDTLNDDSSTNDTTPSRSDIIKDIPSTRTILLSATLPNADFTYELRDAINDNTLTDYDVTIPIYSSTPTIEQQVDFISHNKQFVRILAYCNSLKTAKELQEVFIKRKIPAGYFDGNTDMYTRMRIINELSIGKIRVLCTVRTIGVGTNIPNADTCWFVEERRSVIDVIQCVGRVLRKSDDKIISHIILPSVITKDDTVDESYIQSMSRFMKMMADYDYDIKHRRNTKTLHSRFILNSSDKENTDVESSTLLDTAVFNRMGVMIAGQWMIRFEELKQYVEEHGRIPPKSYGSLSRWCDTQRQAKKGQGSWIITEERIKLLESIQGWYWEKSDEWTPMFEELKKYVEEHGRIPPRSYGNLSKWCDNQKQAKKGQGRLIINEERIKLLETIQGWYWEKSDEWYSIFEELKQYVEEHNCIPPQSAGSLGIWSQKQRQAKKGQDGRIITEERIKLLESIQGWYWGVPTSQEHFISILKDYINKYNKLPDCIGHPNTPTTHNNYDIKPFMRMGYMKRSLDENIQKEFDDIIFKYEPNSYNWKPAKW